jgi:predicted translin family RNA/ssDNA-binding protein
MNEKCVYIDIINVVSGLQEFIEALTLYYFMTDGSLYNWDQIKEEFHFDEDIFGEDPNSEENIEDSDGITKTETGTLDEVKGEDSESGVIANVIDTRTINLFLPLHDYILGVQDLSGEVCDCLIYL